MKLTFKITLLLWVFAVGWFLVSAAPIMAATQFDTEDSYEQNMFLPGLDIYVNQTAPAFYALGLNALTPEFEIVHYMVFPNSVSLDDFTILDPSVRLRFGFGGVGMTQVKQSNGLGLNTLEDVTEAGNSKFASREASRIENDPLSDTLIGDAGVNVDTVYEQWNTETMATVTQNYTIPNTQVTGVSYVANDDKSVKEWGQDLSEADGGTFHNIANASMIGFAFENYDQLEGVTWGFDENSAAGLGLSGFTIKRSRVWLHTAKYTAQGYRGIQGVARKIDNSVFKPIKNAGSTLAAIPAKVTNFFKKTIASSWQTVKNTVGSLAKGIKGALRALLPIALLIGAILLYVWYKKN